MDLIRSKLIGVDPGEEVPQLRSGVHESMDDILKRVEEETKFSEDAVTESDDENLEDGHKREVYAKKSIKREKKKEKDLRKKMEKNIITMDDFLGKQSEFKMWLCEEKNKNTGEMTSPKLKTYFKQFMKFWNKRKLPKKYYGGSTLSESRAALTPTKDSRNVRVEDDGAGVVLEPPKSPFVTFGKTPPKVFQNKKMKVEFPTTGVSLISVVPIDSPKPQVRHQLNSASEYQVPKINSNTSSEQRSNVFSSPSHAESWDHHICSAPTEPGSRVTSTSDSPHVPPPPPPRQDSLKSPKLSHDYIDPYDTIPGSANRSETDSGYSDPINCVFSDYPKIQQNKLNNENENVDLGNNSTRKVPPDDEYLYAKPMKKVKRELTDEPVDKTADKLDDKTAVKDSPLPTAEKTGGGLYAEIVQHINDKTDPSNHPKQKPPIPRKRNHDYATINECMMNKNDDDAIKSVASEQGVKSSDENVGKSKPINSEPENLSSDLNDLPPPKPCTMSRAPSPKFATISRVKKLTVMAASTEKIYETYLSYGKKTELQRYRKEIKSFAPLKPLSQRSRSQPDMFTGVGMTSFEVDIDNKNSESDRDVEDTYRKTDRSIEDTYRKSDRNIEYTYRKSGRNIEDTYRKSGRNIEDTYRKTDRNIEDTYRKTDRNIEDTYRNDDNGRAGRMFSSFKPKGSKSNHSSNKMNRSVDNLTDTSFHGTPVIMATPSFESLYSETAGQNMDSSSSDSSKSMSMESTSEESLWSKSSHSEMTSSSLSMSPDCYYVAPVDPQKSLWSKSSHSEMTSSSLSMSPDCYYVAPVDPQKGPVVPPKGPGLKQQLQEQKQLLQQQYQINRQQLQPSIVSNTPADVNNETGPQDQPTATSNNTKPTPPKRTTLKNGIDLSVYLLKPKNEIVPKSTDTQNENCSEIVEGYTSEYSANQKPHMSTFKGPLTSNMNTDLTYGGNTDFVMGSKSTTTTFKDTLSGVKAKVTSVPKPCVPSNSRPEGNLNQELVLKKPPVPCKGTPIPSIGIASRTRSLNRQKDPGQMARPEQNNMGNFDEIYMPDFKHEFDEVTRSGNKHEFEKRNYDNKHELGEVNRSGNKHDNKGKFDEVNRSDNKHNNRGEFEGITRSGNKQEFEKRSYDNKHEKRNFGNKHEHDEVNRSGNKREFEQLNRSESQYLETDLDNLVNDDTRQPMKKSKSLGKVEPSADTVVTDIW